MNFACSRFISQAVDRILKALEQSWSWGADSSIMTKEAMWFHHGEVLRFWRVCFSLVIEDAVTTKFCNLYRASRVPGRGIVVALEASSTNVTACGSSDQKLEKILFDDPATPTVCTSLS